MARFIWTAWNTAHIAIHGVTREEAEFVVTHRKRPYPMAQGDVKWLVRGQTHRSRYIQVVYVLESDANIDYAEIDLLQLSEKADAFYVIHARPLEESEKRNLRKQRRKRQ